jgi:hypothetical protein
MMLKTTTTLAFTTAGLKSFPTEFNCSALQGNQG